MKNALLHEGLEYWRRERPDHPALAMEEDEISYADAGRISDQIGFRLRRMGLEVGDRVGICGDNSLDWVLAAFGVLKAGGVIVPFNQRYVRDELAHLVLVAEPKIIFSDFARAPLLRSIAGATPVLALEDLRQSEMNSPDLKEPAISSDAMAMILFTSGTTGRPKGVVFTHEGLLSKYFCMSLMDPNYGPHMQFLLEHPIHTAAGTQWGFLPTTVHGGTFHLAPRFDAGATLAAIERHGITHLSGVPVIWEQTWMHPAFETTDLSTLKTAVVGGARVSPQMLKAWRGRGVPLRQNYGMTEVGGFGTLSTDAELAADADTCGRGVMFSKLRVVRPDGTDCVPNEPGDVIMKPTGGMHGYWRDDKATAETVVDGWLRSGDIGVFNDAGYFKFIDRAKDMIISGGYNISPTEIENVILDTSEVEEVAVIPATDIKFGETPAAIIYSDKNVDLKWIVEYCNAHLADFKVPRYIAVAKERLPRMSSGKIDRRRLKSEYADMSQRFPKLR
jgi:fatty-acyl-CoA synthase